MKTAIFHKHCYAGPGASALIRRSHLPRRAVVTAPRLTMPAPASASAKPAPAMRGEPSGPAMHPVPRVLHIDADLQAARSLRALLAPEARLIHAASLADARRLLQCEIFSLVVLDPRLPDGDGASLLPALANTPLLVYSATQPEWRGRAYLSKPWTSPRQLWSAISGMLGIGFNLTAGD